MDIDFRPYVTPTRFSNAMGIVIAIQLLRAAAIAGNDAVLAALAKMREAALYAQSIAVARLKGSGELLKPVDVRHDASIMGLREVLEGKARLEGTEIGERAARLLPLVFPNGTGFVQLSFPQQWASTQSHLERIDQDGLAAEIDAVAGPEFLPYIRAAHAELGEGLGVGESALAAPDTAALRESNLRLARAIANYGRAMVATVNEDDPESVAAFKRAMYPLDAYRRSAFAKAAETETEGDDPQPDTDVRPTDPIPPVPSPA